MIYGSDEYKAEVARIHEREAYGIWNTAGDWRWLNERVVYTPWAGFAWKLIGLASIGVLWLASFGLLGLLVLNLIKTFNLIQ